MPATLDEALRDLDRIVETTRRDRSRLALFPAMYRQVTRAIHRAVSEGGLFDDDERLERLAATFAGRYVTAFDDHRRGRPVPRSWRIAFETAEKPRRRMIVQHLLLGMNAHINLDLGISTAEVGGDEIGGMRRDFVRVNEVLFAMVDRLQEGLSDVSPRMGLLDRWGGSWDESLMRVGIRRARSMAWPFASSVAATMGPDRDALIAERDEDAEFLAHLIARRWSPIHLLGRLVVWAEVSDVRAIVDALDRVEVDPFEVGDVDPSVLLDAAPSLRDAARPRVLPSRRTAFRPY